MIATKAKSIAIIETGRRTIHVHVECDGELPRKNFDRAGCNSDAVALLSVSKISAASFSAREEASTR